MDIDFESFIKERYEAFLSLDKKKIISYMTKYGVDIPKSELVFWAVVHKAILQLKSASEEQKTKSLTWLIENGFSPTIS